MRRKPHISEFITCVITLAIIVAGLFMPKTGTFVLADEFCDVIAVWAVCALVILRIAQREKIPAPSKQGIRVLIMAICVMVSVLTALAPTLDLIAGPENTKLTDIRFSKSQAHTGIFSLHYYLEGTDGQGDRVRLEISGDDYTRLAKSSSVIAEYYRHTGRALSVQGNS